MKSLAKLTVDISHCNLKCAMCPRGGVSELKNERKGLMDFEFFKRIIDKFIEEEIKIINLEFGSWGEPLLNSSLPQMVNYAKIKLNPNHIPVNTNLNYLKNPVDLLNSGLSLFRVSTSGMTQEIYSKNHIGGDVKLLINNLKTLIKNKNQLNNNTRIQLIFHNYIYNKKDAELAREFCKENNIGFVLTRTYIHSVEDCIKFHQEKQRLSKFYENFIDLQNEISLMKTLDNPKNCHLLNNQVVINFDGQLYRCCGVFEEKHFIGNLFDFNIKDIQNIKVEVCELCVKTPMSWR